MVTTTTLIIFDAPPTNPPTSRCFGVITLGIAAYMVHEFRAASFKPPNETIIPLVAGILTVIFTAFSIAAVFFLSYAMQLVAVAFDFIIWLFYLASAGLLRHDYHVRRIRNPLFFSVVGVRIIRGKNAHAHMQSGLVKMLGAAVLIQIILFFFTMILGVFAAMKSKDELPVRQRKPETAEVPV